MKHWVTILIILLLVSCEKEPVETIYFDLAGKDGVFITCEGNFMYGNASLSFYDKEEKRVYNQIYAARNNAPLGDVAQSVTRIGGKLYIVVNNSGKIVVANSQTIGFEGVIPGLTSPRYIHLVNENKAYVSDLYARAITIINPKNNTITGRIDVSDGKKLYQRHATEQFAEAEGKIFVTCWSNDEYILVIDCGNDIVTDSIKTPLQPKDIVVDKNNKLWVMCDGGYEGSPLGNTPPALLRIDPVTLTIEQKFSFSQNNDAPTQLAINSTFDTLLFVSGGVHKMGVDSRYLPDVPFIPASGHLYYSLGVDPYNDEIYLADAIDYTQSAIIYRYSKAGKLIDSFKVGITPGSYLFTE